MIFLFDANSVIFHLYTKKLLIIWDVWMPTIVLFNETLNMYFDCPVYASEFESIR